MQKSLSYYKLLVKRWIWVVVLGIVICGGATYAVSKLIRSTYRASATIFINFNTASSAYDNTTASLEAVQTYAQLLTSSVVLDPVLAQHRGLTLQDLDALITVKPEANTQLIELDVDNYRPSLAMELANEVSQSFAQYASSQLPVSVQIIPAVLPESPIKPLPSLYAGIGALVGLGLALTLIVIFEWTDDRTRSSEEVQEILDAETLAVIPKLPPGKGIKKAEEAPALAEGCRMLCASLNAAQAIKPFKMVMVTSTLTDEGKSTIAANFAIFLAMEGKQVLLIDADLRRSGLGQRFRLDNHRGLSTFLKIHSPIDGELIGQPTGITGLRVLPAGTPLADYTELLQSTVADRLFDYLKKAPFDYVIFDTPPLLPVADTQALALHVPMAVLVVDVSKTTRKDLLRVKRLLLRTRTMILGTALNKCPWSDYSGMGHYLSSMARQRSEFITTFVPDTPSLGKPENGVTDPDVTITLSRQRLSKDE